MIHSVPIHAYIWTDVQMGADPNVQWVVLLPHQHQQQSVKSKLKNSTIKHWICFIYYSFTELQNYCNTRWEWMRNIAFLRNKSVIIPLYRVREVNAYRQAYMCSTHTHTHTHTQTHTHLWFVCASMFVYVYVEVCRIQFSESVIYLLQELSRLEHVF
jgi:fucose permease